MSFPSTLKPILDALAELYPNPEEVRALLEVADLPTRKISFQGSADDVWHSTLREAHKDHRVELILAAAREDYPCRISELGSAVETYRRGLPVGQAEVSNDANRSVTVPVLDTSTWLGYVEANAGHPRSLAVVLGGERPVAPTDEVQARDLEELFTSASRPLAGWPTTLPDGRWLERPELQELMSAITAGQPTQTVLLGPPGSGKSAILAKLVAGLRATGVATLAIKADLLRKSIRNGQDLQTWLQLPVPVDAAIRTVARTRPVVLVLDQLDALADLVDLHSERLHVLLDLVGLLAGRRNVYIVCSCREFEYAHDARFRLLESNELRLASLAWVAVADALTVAGIAPDALPPDMQELLRIPQHLILFLRQFRGGGEQPVVTTFHQLCAAVWDRDVREPGGGRDTVLYDLASRISDSEELWQDRAAFDDRAAVVDALVGCGWLAFADDGFRVGFRHQTLYEFTRAKAFAARPGTLSDHILARQDALFCRPVLWGALQYLRQVNPSGYRNEFDTIWKAHALRRHLKHLLIDHLGLVERPEPADWEELLLLAALKDPDWRLKVLNTLAGKSVWFRRLADTAIAGEMRRPEDEAWPILWVLRSALETDDHDRAVRLMRDHWLADPAKVGMIWSALSFQKKWSAAAVDLLTSVVRRTEIAEVWHVSDDIAKVLPVAAIGLLAAWADAIVGRIRPLAEPDPRAKAFGDLMERMNRWDHLDKLAMAEPVEFVTRMWPVVREVLAALPTRTDGYRVRYSHADSWRTRIDREEYSSIDSRDWLLVATDKALAAFVRSSPDGFLNLVRGSEGSDSSVVHRLLGRAFRLLAAVRPEDALAFLLADPRRFWLGGMHDGLSDTIGLVAALGAHAADKELMRLVEAIRSWVCYRDLGVPITADEPEAKYVRGHRLRLLSVIPAHRLAPSLREELERERAALPAYATTADGISPVEMTWIGSPVSGDEMAALSDDDLAVRIEKLPDATEWHHPKDFMTGGSVQQSREFEKFVAANPERGMAQVARLRPGLHERYAAAAVRGLAEANRPVAEILDVVAGLDGRGFVGREFRETVAFTVNDLARSGGLPDSFCELLDRWRVADWPDNDDNDDGVDPGERERRQSILWAFAGTMMLPHGRFPILSALTRGYLGRTPHAADRWLDTLTDHLDRRETVTVWRAMCLFLPDLRCCLDREKSGQFLVRLFDEYPAVLRSAVGVRALARVAELLPSPARERAYTVVRDWGGGVGPQAFGEVVALRQVGYPDDIWAGATVEAAFAGELAPDSSGILVGIAYAAANTWHEPKARQAATSLLLRLFDRNEPAVLAAAGTVFLRDRVFPTDEHTRALFRRIADRPETLAHLDAADCLFDHLLDLFTDDPGVVCRIAEEFVRRGGETLRTLSGRAFMATPHLVDLAIRLQRLTEYRSRGLALFESLLDLGVNEAVQTLQENDHRLGTRSQRLPRRRRAAEIAEDVEDETE